MAKSACERRIASLFLLMFCSGYLIGVRAQSAEARFTSCFWLQSGGPRMSVQLGWRDATSASKAAAGSQLLPPTASVDRLSLPSPRPCTMDTVALLGSHTMGVGHCENIKNRLYPNRLSGDSCAGVFIPFLCLLTGAISNYPEKPS